MLLISFSVWHTVTQAILQSQMNKLEMNQLEEDQENSAVVGLL